MHLSMGNSAIPIRIRVFFKFIDLKITKYTVRFGFVSVKVHPWPSCDRVAVHIAVSWL